MKVSRSEPRFYPTGRIECGNCRGTGLDGFGIMPDSFPCEACDGKGSHKIDPDEKWVPLTDFLKGKNGEENS